MYNINTINQSANHTKFVAEQIRASNKMPFTDILSTDAINKHLGNIEYRERFFPPDVTIFGFLAQVMGEDQSCQAAVAQLIARSVIEGKKVPSANTSAYSKARERLSEEILSGLVKESGEALEKQAELDWLWQGRHVKLIDGSTISMPDTVENQEIYPQPDSQKKGVGFPIARVVAVISLATGAVLDFAMGPYAGKETGEHALLRQLVPSFQAGDIVLGDCYYASFF